VYSELVLVFLGPILFSLHGCGSNSSSTTTTTKPSMVFPDLGSKIHLLTAVANIETNRVIGSQTAVMLSTQKLWLAITGEGDRCEVRHRLDFTTKLPMPVNKSLDVSSITIGSAKSDAMMVTTKNSDGSCVAAAKQKDCDLKFKVPTSAVQNGEVECPSSAPGRCTRWASTDTSATGSRTQDFYLTLEGNKLDAITTNDVDSSRSLEIRTRTRMVFSTWDTDAAIDDSVFAIPKDWKIPEAEQAQAPVLV